MVLVVEREGHVAGAIQFEQGDDPMYQHAGIDMFLGGRWQRAGLGPEAIRAVVEHLFDVLGHHRLLIDPGGRERAGDPCLWEGRVPRRRHDAALSRRAGYLPGARTRPRRSRSSNSVPSTTTVSAPLAPSPTTNRSSSRLALSAGLQVPPMQTSTWPSGVRDRSRVAGASIASTAYRRLATSVRAEKSGSQVLRSTALPSWMAVNGLLKEPQLRCTVWVGPSSPHAIKATPPQRTARRELATTRSMALSGARSGPGAEA